MPDDTARPTTALIAEDEPLLARTLQRQLAAAWPALRVLAVAEDGVAATTQALELLPEVLFLDIRMPGRSGLAVAEAVADEWPDDRPQPLFVFATAYDAHAVDAFERAAVDYLLKPVTPERLALAVRRLQQRLAERDAASSAADAGDGEARAALVRRVQALDPPPAPSADADAMPARIRVIRAASGATVRMIPLAEVILLEAADKYVNVVTEAGDFLVRISLRELATRLDGVEFVQVHRAVLVNAERIRCATRDEAGHYWLQLQGLARPVKASRAFGHLFKPM
jgi:DNA-binding LytR/AlgR family response regulator